MKASREEEVYEGIKERGDMIQAALRQKTKGERQFMQPEVKWEDVLYSNDLQMRGLIPPEQFTKIMEIWSKQNAGR